MESVTNQNPRATASFLSRLTFSWMGDVLKIGSQQPLEEKHLFPLETQFQSDQLVCSLEREWIDEKRASLQNGSKPRLWRAMMRIISFKDFITVIILRILYSFAFNLLPLFLWFFLKSISAELNYAYTFPLVIFISLASIARSLLLSQGYFRAKMIAIKLNVALIGLLYKKILSLNRCVLQDSVSENTINLVSNDAQAIVRMGYGGFAFSFVALDIAISLVLVWYLVAWQALIGVCVFLFLSVLEAIGARKAGIVRKKAAAQTDKRLEIMKEIVAGIRIVKMYAWEFKYKDMVEQIRRQEISLIRIRGFIISTVYALFFTSNSIAGCVSILTLLLTGHSLTSFKVFTLLSIYANVKFFVSIFIGECLVYLADAKTACDRMQKLIEKKAVLTWPPRDPNFTSTPLIAYFKGRRYKSPLFRHDSLKGGKPSLVSVQKRDDASRPIQAYASLDDVSCYWTSTSERPALQNLSLKVTRGQLLGIAGSVGSGKTSLLMNMLGELPVFTGHVTCIGKIAYVAQMPWVFSGTMRENITFGMPFIEDKYQKILKVCDLEKDLRTFPKRDLTEIGQRGVILSGGQRARLSLARAMYSDADIYLMDDPLSAVDAKVSKQLFERCIKKFLVGRLRILVTHQVQFLKHTDNMIILQNGCLVFQGTYSEMRRQRLRLISTLSQGRSDSQTDDILKVLGEEGTYDEFNPVDENPDRVDLKEEEEERMIGAVKWQLYWKYWRAALPVAGILSLAVFFAFVQVLGIGPYWWLTIMMEMPYEQQRNYITLLMYGGIVTVSLVLTTASSFCFFLTALKASENLHNKMTHAVIKAPVLFFDTNPVGRVLNRFSRDTGNMDDQLPTISLFAVQLCLYFASAIILSATTNIWLFIVCAPLTAVFVYLAKYYLKSSRELRRLEAVTCSPVYSLIADTLTGLEVIRSSKMEEEFLKKFYKYQDKNTSALIMLSASTRWLGIRGDALSNLLVTSVSAGALFATQNPALAGMSLTFAAETLESSQYGIRVASETENFMTSVERVVAYADIEVEPGYNTGQLPPQEWPTKGSLTLQDLSLSYLKGTPNTLKGISVNIAAKEKVGVVGRTGAGKSSIVAALFRMPEPSGRVIVDGVNLRDINLQASRRSMAVITQDPVLFSGSLRSNLDPFGVHKDVDLWNALEEVRMNSIVQALPGQLEFKVKESGSNFSVGERQLVCLARALLQKSKIIILDEATANVDYRTDRLIQEVIHSRFEDSTVLTIAHRLNTIMEYDKVLVMDQGRVVEFDNPRVLLQKNNGHFSRLVEIFNLNRAR
ncbi:ATP-binding cassette sub-family C member 4-like [Montipora foliosa]|uniref:ATP-binding cassette sub-family C member 4-like n=1 Tax=Montipora foliosa TaxID=591990 RepID=UPI0035F11B00